MHRQYQLKRHHLSIPGPAGGYYPGPVALRRAEVLTTAGRLEQALAVYRENLDWAERSQDIALLARSHFVLARQYIILSRNDEAVSHLDQAEALYQGQRDDAGLSRVLLERADIHRAWGRFDEALRMLEKQRTLADEGSFYQGLSLKGNIHFWRGEFDQAREAFLRHLEYSRSRGMKEAEITSLINLGLVYREQQQLGQAMERLTEAMVMSQELGILAYYAMALGSIGGLHTYRKEFQRAIQCFTDQLRLARRMGDKFSACCAIGDMGAVYIELGEYASAREWINQEMDLCREMKDELGISFARYKESIILTEQGELPQALDLARASIDEVRRLGSDRFLELYLCQLAEIQFMLGNFTAAARANDESLALQSQGSQAAVPNAVMRAKLAARDDPARAEATLLGLLQTKSDEQAAIYKALYCVTRKEEYRAKAMELFTAQCQESPTPKLMKEIEGLSGSG